MTATDRSARADAIDVVIGAFAHVGQVAGVPISDTDVAVLKPFVRCVANGTPVVDCARKAVVSQLPPGTRQFADCLTQGSPPATCAAQAAASQLPPSSRALAECVASSNNMAMCGRTFAQTEAEQNAFSTVTKLGAGEVDRFGDPVGPIQNVLGAVQGVVEGDWQKVLDNGGKAVGVYVVNVTLTSLAPGIAQLVSPFVETIVEHRIDLVSGLVSAAMSGDASAAARVITDFYLTYPFVVPCQLLPEGVVKESICGTLGKIIGTVASGVGDAVGFATGLVGDALDLLGLPSSFDDIGRIFSGKEDPSVCGTPQQWYTNNYAMCFQRGVSHAKNGGEALELVIGDINGACRRHFDQCYTSGYFDRFCNPLKDLYRNQVNQITESLKQAGDAYRIKVLREIAVDPIGICGDSANWASSKVGECMTALRQNFPLVSEPNDGRCGVTERIVSSSPFQLMCEGIRESVLGNCDLRRVARKDSVEVRDPVLDRLLSKDEPVSNREAVETDRVRVPTHLTAISIARNAGVDAQSVPPVSGGASSPSAGLPSGGGLHRADPVPPRVPRPPRPSKPPTAAVPPAASGGSYGAQPSVPQGHSAATSQALMGIIGTVIGGAISDRGGGIGFNPRDRAQPGPSPFGGPSSAGPTGKGPKKPGGPTAGPPKGPKKPVPGPSKPPISIDPNINYGECANCKGPSDHLK